MTNLLSLPQIPAGTSITISSSADWNDQFFIGSPNFPSAPIVITGTLNGSTSNVITNIISTSGFVPGMAVSGFGIPQGTIIASGGVGLSFLTLNNNTTISTANSQLLILPPPLDLTGITFSSMIRTTATSTSVIINMTTTNGLMYNGYQSGIFGWSLPTAKMPAWPSISATGQLALVLDIHATDITGAIVDLCALNGPIPLTVNLGVVR